jgi:hypothetical protein
MRHSIVRRLALAAALAGAAAGCQSESRNIPNLTAEAASRLPPGQLPGYSGTRPIPMATPTTSTRPMASAAIPTIARDGVASTSTAAAYDGAHGAVRSLEQP